MGLSLLAWIRDRSSKFFHRFGIHCATHQIRLILISGLVITSLFYPALGIYTSSSSKLLTTSTHILGHIDLRSLSFFDDDLDSVWSGQDALRIIEDTVARARCGMEETIRIERILLTSPGFESDTGAINHRMLHSVLKLETMLTDHLLLNKFSCLRSPSRRCITLSPLEFWSHDEDILRTDSDLLRTINKNQSITSAGLPLKAPMVFAGRESAEPHGSSIDFAAYLALSYFFHEDDCNGSIGHDAWLTALDSIITPLGDISVKAEEPVLLALEHDPDMKSSQHISLMTSTLYLSYIIFFIYFSGSMRRMDTVHSRVGLCFTGLVEILVSTITSLSVCALFGLRITLVPWGIFPIVIVFVGAENMFRLIDDVVKTPISLPVKERIGLGLSRAGTSNTLKVVSYNAIFGSCSSLTGSSFTPFFVAVLSIDIQRLELDDLLRQDPSLSPSSHTNVISGRPTDKLTVLSKINRAIQKITKGRVAKNVSLMLMLVITATLYYSTLPPHSIHFKDELHTPASRASISRSKARLSSVHSEAYEIWRVLSPNDDLRIHMRIEAPAIVKLDYQFENAKAERRLHKPRWSVRTFRPLWWISKVVVLPIGATLICLYVFLLYLLKGADRLETHRGHNEDNSETVPPPIEGRPSFETFPCAFPTDVGLLASNGNGTILASISSGGEFVLWLAAYRKYIQVDTTDLASVSRSSAQCALTTIAVDDRGAYCAVGTGSGLIMIWSIQGDSVHLVAHHFMDECTAPIVELKLIASDVHPWDQPPTSKKAQTPNVPSNSIPCVFAIYGNGRAVQWLNGIAMHLTPQSCGEVIKATLIHLSDSMYPVICFFFDNGGLEIVDNGQAAFIGGPIFIHAGTSNDRIVDVHACVVRIEGVPHVLVAAVRHSGIITLWDRSTGDCVSTLDDAYGFVNNLKLIPISAKACLQCGEVPLCSFSLVYSVGHVVFVDRGNLARRCSCPISHPLISKKGTLKDMSIGLRSRSGSFVSSFGTEAISRPRSRLSSVSSEKPPDISSFPISAHGMHSRRGSEKDGRRNSDRSDRPSSMHEDISSYDDEQQRLMVPDLLRPACSTSGASVACLWRNFRLIRVTEATCERGGWDIMGSKVVGMRRRPRKRHRPGEEPVRLPKRESQSTLSLSVLDRWEVWIVDPAKLDGLPQASPLSALRLKSTNPDDDDPGEPVRKPIPRLSFTRLSSLAIRGSICLAGFGNTVGMIDFESQ
ncbi:hypothetical protein EW145_g2073 [Phellinidium pouzarii]|uniref:SSD domain-containing protein n=1 Tax=Phellinidium pouzarii TaxID=167371 RepID=A0A4S4LHR0_9AGAM|nr:hypothetical protein EW145_g2073 [Phellinidium pouzarii]